MLLGEPSQTPIEGIGKRSDMIRWAYRDESGELLAEGSPSPSTLMLAYQITGDETYAARSMELAACRLRLARGCLRDGRRHGCGARSVSAVASGHGRDSGYGNVTGSFYALTLGATRYAAHEHAAIEVPPTGHPGDTALLTRIPPGEDPETVVAEASG